jgi:hypothetical protein
VNRIEREQLAEAVSRLTEELAAAEHDRWAHWQNYVHSKGLRQPDGSLLIPGDLVSRWERQIATTYNELSEQEKESDRDQVRKYMPLIVAAIEATVSGRDK